MPRNECTWLMFPGVGKCCIAFTFSGDGMIPSGDNAEIGPRQLLP